MSDQPNNPKSEEQVLADSDQFWSEHELDDDKVEAIADPVAQAHARAALERRRLKEEAGE